MKEVETALAEVNSVVAKLEEEETELRKQHIEVKHKFEKFDAVVKENKDKIKHWKKEVSSSKCKKSLKMDNYWNLQQGY